MVIAAVDLYTAHSPHPLMYICITLPETNSSPLKMDGWNTIVSFWGPGYFQVRTVSFRERI